MKYTLVPSWLNNSKKTKKTFDKSLRLSVPFGLTEFLFCCSSSILLLDFELTRLFLLLLSLLLLSRKACPK